MTIRSRLILTDSEGKLFIVKHNHKMDYWALPGGKMDGNENTRECMIREIEEEFNMKLSNPRLKFIVENLPVNSIEFFFFEETNEPTKWLEADGSMGFEIADKKFVDVKNTKLEILPHFLKEKVDGIKDINEVEYILIEGDYVYK